MNTITFIGGGNMARSLIGGLIKAGTDAKQIHVAEPGEEARRKLENDFGVTTHADNAQAIKTANTIVFAVKPQILKGVCQQLGSTIADTQPLVISIAAGIRSDQVATWLGCQAAIVRVMPNTPALIAAGASGLYATDQVDATQRQRAETILQASGLCAWIDNETLMDTVTALSGSGPAYFFAMVEAMIEAATHQGLDQETARQLAAQTCMGAGRMMVESSESPAQLRRRVTSPNGTTQAALESFSHDGLPQMVHQAMEAARARGVELAKANDKD